MPSSRRDTGYLPRPAEDLYGKLSVDGAKAIFGPTKIKTIRSRAKAYYHRTKNGVNDPYTYFHVAEAILAAEPDQKWTSAQLTDWLNENAPQLIWDSVTVGRVLYDLYDNWIDVEGSEDYTPLKRMRLYDGVFYRVNATPHTWAVLNNLIEDLVKVCDRLQKQEREGVLPKRTESPLLACPSVMQPLRDRMAEGAA